MIENNISIKNPQTKIGLRVGNQLIHKKQRLSKIRKGQSFSNKVNNERLNLVLEIYGHAWCLDNQLEIKKLVKLISSEFELKPKN